MLLRLGVSPYIGSSCSVPPLLLHIFSALPAKGSALLQVLADVLSGLILYRMMLQGYSGE